MVRPMDQAELFWCYYSTSAIWKIFGPVIRKSNHWKKKWKQSQIYILERSGKLVKVRRVTILAAIARIVRNKLEKIHSREKRRMMMKN